MPVKMHLALYIGGMGARGKNFYNDYAKRLGYEEAAERIQDLYLAGKKMEAVAAVPDALVDDVHLVGPRERIRERLAAWREAGKQAPRGHHARRHRPARGARAAGRRAALASAAHAVMDATYPGAVPPERHRTLASLGLRLHVAEWGDPAAEPVLLLHGFYDHVHAFDLLAPLLAERFRVVAYDARGHGESEWPDAYAWQTDVLDAVHVLRDLGRPAHVVGHSRGGGLATDTARLLPRRPCASWSCSTASARRRGFGTPPSSIAAPGHGTAEQLRDVARLAPRRGVARASFQPAAALRRAGAAPSGAEPAALARVAALLRGARLARGARRLRLELRSAGVARRSARSGPDWIAPGWRRLRAPMLAVIGSEPDTWGPLPESILARAALARARADARDGAGRGPLHAHREAARDRALILDFLEARVIRLQSGRIEVALHDAARRRGPDAPVSARAARARRRLRRARAGSGRAACSRSTSAGHGASDRPRGAELHAGAAGRRRRRGARARGRRGVRGRASGVGAYVALLLAGARPQRVRAAYLLPGAGSRAAARCRARSVDGEALRVEVAALLEAAAQRDAAGPATRWCACSTTTRARPTTRAASPTPRGACCWPRTASCARPGGRRRASPRRALRAPAGSARGARSCCADQRRLRAMPDRGDPRPRPTTTTEAKLPFAERWVAPFVREPLLWPVAAS